MVKRKDYKRYSNRKKIDFHGAYRMQTRMAIHFEDFESLPEKESSRMVLWKGRNDFGDNTSLGGGDVEYDMFEKLLNKYIGKTFDEYYSAMCIRFRGYDRYCFDRFIRWAFRLRWIFGYKLMTKYFVEDGIITVNED